MIRPGLASTVGILLVGAASWAQVASGQNSAVSIASASASLITISGTVAQDGKVLVQEDEPSLVSEKTGAHWNIANPDALRRHDGQRVNIKGRVTPNNRMIYVLKIKMRTEISRGARLGDSAFRR